jgi:hypothetical protein
LENKTKQNKRNVEWYYFPNIFEEATKNDSNIMLKYNNKVKNNMSGMKRKTEI